MARSTNPLRLKGKIGDLVFYERFGKSYVRSAPVKRKKKLVTEKLSNAQSRFALANSTARGLKNVIDEAYIEFKGKASLYHKALGEINLFAITLNESEKPKINFKTLPVALGTLNPPIELQVIKNENNHKLVEISWKSTMGDKSDTLSWIMVYEILENSNLEAELVHTMIERDAEKAEIEITTTNEEERVHLYAFFRNEEKKRNSSSLYCCSIS